ncbi:MAG: cation transporter [Euryarchaeota archaeon]|nr:cation transporter [Euryarchaeota archaeon]
MERMVRAAMKHAHAPKHANGCPDGHDHGEGHHDHARTHRALSRRRLALAIGLTAAMMVAEIIGGWLSNSLALLSDAGHMFTHFLALALSYAAIRLACRATAREKSFGLYRVEVLAAFINAITLVMITIFLLNEAYQRILSPAPIAETEMLIVAAAGLAVNLITAGILMGAERDDLNVRSAYVHMLGDTVSSVAVVIGAIAIHYTGWVIIDPILSIVICAVILVWAAGIFRDSIRILLESAPAHIKVADVAAAIKGCASEIREVHDVHVWEITSKMYSMTAHVVVPDCKLSDCGGILAKINDVLDKRFDITHASIQFECG